MCSVGFPADSYQCRSLHSPRNHVVFIFGKPTASLRFVGHDRDPDAQHELATPVAFVVVQLYDHALTLGQEVNLASFMSSVAI